MVSIEQEMMNGLERIQRNILTAFQDPRISRQNVDKAITMFKQLLDFVIQETHPLTIYKLEQKERLRKHDR